MVEAGARHCRTIMFCRCDVVMLYPEADPGLLERGYICLKVWGFAMFILSLFFFNIL